MKRLIGLLSLLIFVISCTNSSIPKGVLDEMHMKAVLREMHLTDAYLSTISDKDSVAKIAPVYYQTVLKNHQTNLKGFEQSLRYYSERPELLDTFYSQIAKELEPTIKKPKTGKKAVDMPQEVQ